MTDLERVQQWFDSGAFLRPDAAVPNSVDLARALAILADTPSVEPGPSTPAILERIGAPEHTVFALIDGLGTCLLEAWPAESFLRTHVVMELRAVFPSTTAAALHSFATGLWPGRHAVPAWWTHLPDQGITATILPFVERFSERPLQEFGVGPAQAFVASALLPRARASVRTLYPAAIVPERSVFSAHACGPTDASGYGTLPEAVDSVLDRHAAATAPLYTQLYVPSVDTAAHRHGPASAEVRAELAKVEAELARLAAGLRGRGRLVVSADHGMLSVPERGKRLLTPDDDLLAALEVPPSGEPRVPFFHVRAGAGARFERAFRRRFGDIYALLSVAEAEALALFGPGPLAGAARRRIGDFIGLSPAPVALIYGTDLGDSVGALRGYHGGLTPAEMRVPLIVA